MVFKWYYIYIYIYIENVVILFESKSFLFLFKRVLFIAKIKIKKKGGKHMKFFSVPNSPGPTLSLGHLSLRLSVPITLQKSPQGPPLKVRIK